MYSAAPKGWRARVRDATGDQVWLKVRKSAQVAAWDRYLFLQEHGQQLAQDERLSNIALELYQSLKAQNPDWSEEKLVEEAKSMAALFGQA